MEEKIISRLIEDEMKTSYLDYAMSVLIGRALPDVRDGLKPVHKRILFAMHDLGMHHNKPFKKCARIVGEVLGKYHPHGDTAVYDTLVRMAQEWSLRYPLIMGQGNFGSVDGDSAAAMRYTEARLSKLASEMLQDIEKNTVLMVDNFDGSLKEPSVLPGKFPNLLVNGTTGIAVGMATNIPPHNMTEICTAVKRVIDNPQIEISELMDVITGPDFPTGGRIAGRNGIFQAYTTGRGKLRVKGVTEIEQGKIIITEIPYMVSKAGLVEEIAENVKDKRIEGIRDIRDESDRKGMRVVIELKQGANPEIIENLIYKFTRLQVTFGVQNVCIVNGEPKQLTLKQLIEDFIIHRKDVITKRTQYELDQAQARFHILEGIVIALNDIDNVIALIKKASDGKIASEQLQARYALSEKQAGAILDIRLQRLTSMEQNKIREEQEELKSKILFYQGILADETKVYGIIKEDMDYMITTYGDERRTVIVEGEDEDYAIEDLIAPEEQVVTISHEGYIKRIALDTYKTQRRGGVGIKAMETKTEDFTEHVFVANTHDYLLVFTDSGRVHWLKVYQLPEGGRTAKGRPIINLIGTEEKIRAILPIKEFLEGYYVIMATAKGIIKKTDLNAYSKPRKGGIIAINLDEGDDLIDVRLTDGKRNILIATAHGNASRFKESDARAIGRTARGVIGIRLRGDDKVVGMVVPEDNDYILTITENGYGKKTIASEYRLIGRGGLGVINIKTTERNGKVAGIKCVSEDDQIMLISKNGIIIRTGSDQISTIGRNTQGVRIMRMRPDDKVVGFAKIAKEE